MTPKEKANQLIETHKKYCCGDADTIYAHKLTSHGAGNRLGELFRISREQNAINSAIITINEIMCEVSESRKDYVHDVLKELQSMLIDIKE